MYTPHVLTLYNVIEHDDGTVEENVTFLDGVMIQPIMASGKNNNGTVSQDTVKVFIPFTVNATDAFTGAVKPFVQASEYNMLEDKKSAWTLFSGGESSPADCWFAKGHVIIAGGYTRGRAYNDAHAVTSVGTFDFGSKAMQHFEVTAK